MKKITLLLSAVLIFTLSFYSCEESQLDPTDDTSSVINLTETFPLNKDVQEKIRFCGEQEECLTAGQHYDAGKVTIRNDDKNLYVTIYSKEGFKEEEGNIKIWVETTLPNHKPNPAKLTPLIHTTATPMGVPDIEVTYQIPYSDLGINPDIECAPNHFYVIVHADVFAWVKDENEKLVLSPDETAFGGCEMLDVKPWWGYIDYYTQCCECWCGFGNDYQNPEDEACKSGMFDGKEYIFWSNKHNFETIKKSGIEGYRLSLLATPNSCVPQDKNGNIVEDPQTAVEVGQVILKAIDGDGENIEVIYTLNDKYKGYNIQLDLYNGADRVPKYDLKEMMIIQDDLHRLYQTKLTPGEVTYTFTIPLLTNGDSKDTYIALHSAIGDCPMPTLQEPYKP